MTDTIQIVAIMVSGGLFLFVLELVRRRRLTEEYSFIWIVFALGLLTLSVWRESLHAFARWLDVHYPPTVLLGALILFVFVASLYFSVVISQQRDQIERLVQEVACLEARYRTQLTTRSDPASHAGGPVATSAADGPGPVPLSPGRPHPPALRSGALED